jgi:hypothetical protein
VRVVSDSLKRALRDMKDANSEGAILVNLAFLFTSLSPILHRSSDSNVKQAASRLDQVVDVILDSDPAFDHGKETGVFDESAEGLLESSKSKDMKIIAEAKQAAKRMLRSLRGGVEEAEGLEAKFKKFEKEYGTKPNSVHQLATAILIDSERARDYAEQLMDVLNSREG